MVKYVGADWMLHHDAHQAIQSQLQFLVSGSIAHFVFSEHFARCQDCQI